MHRYVWLGNKSVTLQSLSPLITEIQTETRDKIDFLNALLNLPY